MQGNYIGTNAQGTAALPNAGNGVHTGGAQKVTIGGAVSGAGNLISGNTGHGINIGGGINGTPSSALIQGNLVGTDASGTVAIPNGENGIELGVAYSTRVGGTTAKARNIISGNVKAGIRIFQGIRSAPNRIEGNFIGLNIFGTGALANTEHGVLDGGQSPNYVLGGTTPEAGNRIAFNRGSGVASLEGHLLGGSILSNSIFANTKLGIDRGNDGPSPYRGKQGEAPVITSVTTSGSETTIKGNLRAYTFGGAKTPHRIQFFANSSPDPSGFGEGQTFVGETTIQAGSTEEVPFTAKISPALAPGKYVSAVAVGKGEPNDPNSAIYTSEFAFNARVEGKVTPGNTPLQIDALTPSIGGDSGVVTVRVYGQGILPGATVRLRRAGQNDIVGTVLSVSEDGSFVEVTFNLAGKPLGAGYEIVVRNSNGDKAELDNAFTIQQGRGSDIWTEVVGPGLVRVGRSARYFVVYGNNGNVDTEPTRFRVYVPRDFTLGPLSLLEDGSYPAVYRHDAETVLEFYIPRIAPGSSTSVLVQVTPEVDFGQTVPIRVLAQSDAVFKAATDIKVKPNVELTEEVLESTETYTKTKVNVKTPGGNASYTRETTLTDTSTYQDFSEQIIRSGGVVQKITRYTLPKSLVTPQFPDASAQLRSFAHSGAPYSNSVQVSSVANDGRDTMAAGAASSIRPTKGGGVITATIYGLGLHNGMEVKLSRQGQKDIVAKGISATNGGFSALVYFDLRKAALGAWDVVVTDSDRNNPPSRLNGAFTVEPVYVEVKTIRTASEAGAKTTEEAKEAASSANSTRTEKIEDPNDDKEDPFPDDGEDGGKSKEREGEGGSQGGGGGEGCVPGSAGCAPEVPPSRKPEQKPPNPDGSGEGTTNVNPRSSWDPNDKIGPQGGGAKHYISGVEPLNYVIMFENKPEASLPAQEVVITDQLDASKLDLSTFQLGAISFGKDAVAVPPPGLSDWVTDIDLRPANNLIVRVIVGLDQSTGIVTWRFYSLDPATMQPTEDAAAGFLPPNINAPEGDGAVTFSVRAKQGQPAGTEIRNQARIVFDVNPPIDTPEWLNTIDKSKPTSAVKALPESTDSSEFRVTWSGTDTGAGIETYSIYVSEEGGPFRLWLQTSATSAFFQGRPGSTYSFYSVALDGAGNSEAAPGPADASTTTRIGRLLNISTRVHVGTGENALIGGFIVTGTQPKKVIIRAIGSSLTNQGVSGALQNPTLQLVNGAKQEIAFNDDWKDTQQEAIEASGVPPTHEAESAIVRTLAPGNYTAIVRGDAQGTGVGLVEVFDLSAKASSQLVNISSRAFVGTGENVLIGGFISGGGADTRVLIRAIGPSLGAAGIAGALQNPTLELRNANGTLVRENDNWQGSQQGEIEQTKIPPTHAAESALIEVLRAGNYTAIVRGQGGSTGVALVEIYSLQ